MKRHSPEEKTVPSEWGVTDLLTIISVVEILRHVVSHIADYRDQLLAFQSLARTSKQFGNILPQELIIEMIGYLKIFKYWYGGYVHPIKLALINDITENKNKIHHGSKFFSRCLKPQYRPLHEIWTILGKSETRTCTKLHLDKNDKEAERSLRVQSPLTCGGFPSMIASTIWAKYMATGAPFEPDETDMAYFSLADHDHYIYLNSLEQIQEVEGRIALKLTTNPKFTVEIKHSPITPDGAYRTTPGQPIIDGDEKTNYWDSIFGVNGNQTRTHISSVCKVKTLVGYNPPTIAGGLNLDHSYSDIFDIVLCLGLGEEILPKQNTEYYHHEKERHIIPMKELEDPVRRLGLVFESFDISASCFGLHYDLIKVPVDLFTQEEVVIGPDSDLDFKYEPFANCYLYGTPFNYYQMRQKSNGFIPEMVVLQPDSRVPKRLKKYTGRGWKITHGPEHLKLRKGGFGDKIQKMESCLVKYGFLTEEGKSTCCENVQNWGHLGVEWDNILTGANNFVSFVEDDCVEDDQHTINV